MSNREMFMRLDLTILGSVRSEYTADTEYINVF